MIFLSHTNGDKPVVEPIALMLRSLMGEDQVFYDAWSIQPGDGIIDKMSEGLASPSHVFFFVSTASLSSPMVRLEWQNAVYKATKGQTRMIPVRVDGAEMPAILMQNLYVDMYSIGIEAAAKQIRDIVFGKNTFTPKFNTFENLTYKMSRADGGVIIVTLTASHLPEFNLKFAFIFDNAIDDVTVSPESAGMMMSWDPQIQDFQGRKCLVLIVSDQTTQSIKPKFPHRFVVKPKAGVTAKLIAVLHEIAPQEFKPLKMIDDFISIPLNLGGR